jgi:hypothetical protein
VLPDLTNAVQRAAALDAQQNRSSLYDALPLARDVGKARHVDL